jgi:hypothetical protein
MTALAIVSVIALTTGCSETSRPTASAATSFAVGTCSSISAWGNEIVDAANAFTDESARLNTAGRRARYLFAFDNQARITDHLREELQATPATGVADAEAIRAVLFHAVDDVLQNIRDQKADASANVDFHFIGPKPDRLFAGTEKSLSLMLKPLDEIARDRHVDALGGSCGR